MGTSCLRQMTDTAPKSPACIYLVTMSRVQHVLKDCHSEDLQRDVVNYKKLRKRGSTQTQILL